MWIEIFHRFENEAAFLAACDAASWPRGPDGTTSTPAGVVLELENGHHRVAALRL